MRRTFALCAGVAALLACGVEAPHEPTPEPYPTHQAALALVADPCGARCALNPAVTPSTVATTICVSGWTATVRPPQTYTEALKRKQLAAFATRHPGDKNWTAATTEEDHRMPLELGGAPSDEHNLSPEENAGGKDADETSFRRAVCAGKLTLAEAQQRFAAKWLAAWPDYR